MLSQRQSTSASQTPYLSPAELSYLYTSLSSNNNNNKPIRPDGRSPTQFRPLTAESSILPGTNGSARIGFADGTQAIVGVKAEVERNLDTRVDADVDVDADVGGGDGGNGSWVQMSIEIPGFRDDDALPVFLSEMMRESLVGSVGSDSDYSSAGMMGGLKGRLVINRRWHWRLYIDVLLLSQPLSYPLPLLSLTTHLALLSTKLPKLKSQGEEDPLFDDDWDAAEYLYPRQPQQLGSNNNNNIDNDNNKQQQQQQQVRPPITLLVISVGNNIIFDPSREEIAVADSVLAISITRDTDKATTSSSSTKTSENNNNSDINLKLLSIRTIDPPSRLTQPGVPNSENVATVGSTAAAEEAAILNPSTDEGDVVGVWRPRRGGVKREVVSRMVRMVLEKGGVGEEVLEGLEGVEV